MSDRAVYYLAGRPGSSHAAFMSEAPRQQHEDSVYAEVTHIGACDSTQSLDGGDAYKPVEDVRPKHKRSSWVSKVSSPSGVSPYGWVPDNGANT